MILRSRQLYCGWCGRTLLDWGEINGVRYCHDDIPYPTCYMLAVWDRDLPTLDELIKFIRERRMVGGAGGHLAG